MKYIAPDYYKDFACIADRCLHSCCIGWEIDIDEDTLELYDSIPGQFGERLRRGIVHGETPCFRLGEGERCLFLNECGLCDIILNLGEDALCDICTDHPRFRNYFSDRVEIGLGLCCEEACRIILGHKDTVKLILIEDDGSDEPEPEDTAFLNERQSVFDVLQDRSITMEERLCKLEIKYGISKKSVSPAAWAEYYRELERLDPEWEKYLDILAEQDKLCEVNDDPLWEMLAVYLVYRHTADDPSDMERRISFCIHTVKIIRTLCCAENADHEKICEICRMWSSEIEYSDENVGRVLDRLS